MKGRSHNSLYFCTGCGRRCQQCGPKAKDINAWARTLARLCEACYAVRFRVAERLAA